MNITIPMWGYAIEWFAPFFIALYINKVFVRLNWGYSITSSLVMDAVWCMMVAYPVGVGVMFLAIISCGINLYRNNFKGI